MKKNQSLQDRIWSLTDLDVKSNFPATPVLGKFLSLTLFPSCKMGITPPPLQGCSKITDNVYQISTSIHGTKLVFTKWQLKFSLHSLLTIFLNKKQAVTYYLTCVVLVKHIMISVLDESVGELNFLSAAAAAVYLCAVCALFSGQGAYSKEKVPGPHLCPSKASMT